MKTFEDLILVIPDALELKTCSEIIGKFEQDDRKKPGITTHGEHQEIKKSIDLAISPLEEWASIDEILYKSTTESLEKYSDHVEFDGRVYWSANLQDNGYNVKRYSPNDFFHWHTDRYGDSGWSRAVAYIWYLNDVKEGGETEFAFGLKIKPKAGQLILFPACWTFPHRGLPPTNGNKYIITTFMSTSENIPES